MIREISKLDDLMDGAATERFNTELREVLRNVYDPNTDATKKRQISLVFSITPNERRDAADFKMDVKTQLAPPVPIIQTVLLNIDDEGVVTAMERTNQLPGQVDFNGDEIDPKISRFPTQEAK